MNADKIRHVDPLNPEAKIIDEAADIIKQGGIIVFPTRGLYGLGTDALSEKAVDRIFTVKNRDRYKPVLVLVDDESWVDRLAVNISDMARHMMQTFWPGRITLIFDAAADLPANLTGNMPENNMTEGNVTGKTDKIRKIGIRVCRHPAARALIKKAGCPVTGTSANIADQPGCFQISDLDRKIIQKADLIVDAGVLESGVPSTVADVTGKAPKILREGAVSMMEIFNAHPS